MSGARPKVTVAIERGTDKCMSGFGLNPERLNFEARKEGEI